MNTNARHWKRMLAALLVGVGLSVVVWVAGPVGKPAFAAPDAAGDVAQSGGTSGLGKRVKGTWLDDPGAAFQSLRNIHEDGTLIWSHNFEYANPDGAVFGVWKRTGTRELTSRQVGFIYDDDGVHVFTGRITEVTTFDADFQTSESVGMEEIFNADQDPTDPDEEPIFSFEFTFTSKRLNLPD